jgi:deoxyribodipyrimidine photolyase-related protein
MQRLIFVAFDHLNENYGALKNSDPSKDVIVLVESARMTTGRKWHGQRLHYLISSARHFASHLEKLGYTVRYEKAATTIEGLQKVKNEFPELPIISAEPSSFRQYQASCDGYCDCQRE